MFKLVTKAPLNIRSGPGMAFETVGNFPKDKLLDSWEYKKDGSNIGWYRINEGWVCGNYVSLSTENHSEIENSKTIRRVIQAEENTDGETSGVTEKEIEENKKDPTEVGDSASSQIDGSPADIDNIGLKDTTAITDYVLAKRAFGVPYQFMETVDMRYGNTDKELGLDAGIMMAEAPMLSLIPGRPYFLADLDPESKQKFIDGIKDFIDSALSAPKNMINDMVQSNDDLKYFDFEPDVQKYYSYVNTMATLFAVYLGIGHDIVPGSGGITYNKMDWSNYTLANLFAGRPTTDIDMKLGISALPGQLSEKVKDKTTPQEYLGELMKLTDYKMFFVDFYINPRVSYSDSFSNSTKNSALEGLAQQGSDFGKELAFLIAAGANYSGNGYGLEQMTGDVKTAISEYNGNPLIKRILGGASSLISGNNMVFPKIWGGSEYTRNYNIDIQLKTPYGDRHSIFINLLLPLSFLLALALPRQATVNTYASPFIVQGFLPGFCAIEMGIVSSLTINKGGDNGDAWTHDGLPLQLDINMNIEDLYHNLMISGIHNVGITDAINLINNTGLLNYVAVNSGVSLKQYPRDKIKEMCVALVEGTPSRIMSSFDIKARQYGARKVRDTINTLRALPGRLLSNIGL